MSAKADFLRLKKQSLVSSVAAAAAGFLNFFIVGNKIYLKDEEGDLISSETPIARIATSDGLTTGIIAEANTVIQPTSSSSANDIIALPAMVPGDWVKLLPVAGGNGYELRALAAAVATTEFNNVAGTAGLELAIAQDTTIFVQCIATDSIIATKYSNVGAPTSAGTPDV